MVKICVVGCLHGELAKMYEDIRATEIKFGYKVDLVLCCGDFQSVRNESDLTVMSVPPKYRRLGDFWKYYCGELKAPYLTVFIGGNHEASNYLQELPYGGWVAPDIYFMGYAGVLNFRGLRIAGISGIYKRHDFYTGHFEHAPYDDQSQRTAYHVRNLEPFRLSQIRAPVDIVLSHDWPRGIYNYSSELPQLLRAKPHFQDEIQANIFGSPANEEVLVRLRPRYWFSAHHHCKFSASVQFGADGPVTRFLALDKCLPRKHYMQVIDVDPRTDRLEGDGRLELDPEWLCVLRATNHLMSVARTTNIMPVSSNQERCDFSASADDLKELSELFNNQFAVPSNFEPTAPVHFEEYIEASRTPRPVAVFANPQTDLLCAMLDLVNPNATFLGAQVSLDDLSKKLRKTSSSSSSGSSSCCSEAGDDDEDEGGGQGEGGPSMPEYRPQEGECANPEEMALPSEDEDEDVPQEGQEGQEDPPAQYDPADYPDDDDSDHDGGYCPSAPFV